MSESIESVVTECWKAMNALDFDKACSYYADDAVHKDFAINLTMNGQPEILAFWKKWLPFVSNDDYFFDIHSTTLTEDRFTVEWTWYARFDGNFLGMEGGKKFAVPGASVGSFKNGQFTFWCDYYNVATILGQLGMNELPAEILALVPPVE